jgi:antirestriction protein ArdC
MSELENTKTKQQQYKEEALTAIQNAILNSNGKRLDGWNSSANLAAINGIKGREYNGLNAIKLNLQGYSDNRWLTFEQVKELNGTVKKGEKGQTVEIAHFSNVTPLKDPYGGAILDENGKQKYKVEKLDKPVYKYYTVFNIEQTFNIDKSKLFKLQNKAPAEQDIEQRSKRIEGLIEKLGVKVVNGNEKTASYDVQTDTITMPHKDSISSEQYYGALLNQAIKATAHPSRIEGRNIASAFGTKEYAQETLNTEIASMMLSREYGVRINSNLDKDFASSGKTNIETLKGWIKSGTLEQDDIKNSVYQSLKSQRFILKNSPVLEKSAVKEQVQQQQQQQAKETAKETPKKKDKGVGR